MKSIGRLLVEALPSVPIGANGRPDEIEIARLRWMRHCLFWASIRSVLDPRGRMIKWNAAGRSFYNNVPDELRDYEIEESIGRAKLLLGSDRLSVGTWSKLLPVLKKLLLKALDEFTGADIAACAVMQFARLELGEALDPEYGSFHSWKDPREALIDGDWLPEYPVEHETYEHISERRWVRDWNKIMNDPSEFEHTFPGMAHRRVNVVRALRPVCDLDPDHDFFSIVNAVESIRELLKNQFEENFEARPPRDLLDFIA